jgi:hypothetical protein
VTSAGAPAAPRLMRGRRPPGLAAGRLLRLELRRNAMMWMAPVAVGLFWYDAYRQSMALPPLWNVRAMAMQTSALLDFVPPVVGAAAWMGSREGRRHTADQVAATARPRWARQLATWAATTCWAMAAYLGCVGVLYAVTARQAAWGGPLWWPAAVGAAGVPALSAVGFAAGALIPSRFTTPLITVAAFFALGLSAVTPHGGGAWYGVISPIIAGAVDVGPSPGVATFYPYLPDLSIAQTLFLIGFAAAAVGALGLPGGSGGRRLRRSAAAITAAGLLAAGTAVGLAGTARLDAHGMLAIPALHDAANDQPVRYTPVCSHTAVPVCVNPAYAAYLPVVTTALAPVLREVAGLPGAPYHVTQVAPAYKQEHDGISVRLPSPSLTGSPPVFRLALPDSLPGAWVNGAPVTTAEFASQVRSVGAFSIIPAVVYGGNSLGVGPGRGVGGPKAQARQALAAVMAGLLQAAGVPHMVCQGSHCLAEAPGPAPKPGTPVFAAAHRFADLPAFARHAWLVRHLAALRAGRITMAQLP